MDSGVIWTIASIILIMIEMLTGTFVLSCFALGGIAAAIVSIFAGTQWQLGTFAVVTCLFLLLLRIFWPSIKKIGEESGRLSNIDAMIGKTGRVVWDVLPDNTGWVAIDGDVWKASLADGVQAGCLRDSNVVVKKMKGLIIFVEPVGDS